MQRAKNFKELVLLQKKSTKNFQVHEALITANDQGLVSQYCRKICMTHVPSIQHLILQHHFIEKFPMYIFSCICTIVMALNCEQVPQCGQNGSKIADFGSS